MSAERGISAERGAPRAAILITGTEVLSGRVSDRNGPWLADRLQELGVSLAHIAIVGDRPQDMLAALEWMGEQDIDLVITSGGLGPTADDLTAEIVGRFQRRDMVLDGPLEERIAEILAPMAKRWPHLDPAAVRASNRKQAVIPSGSVVLDPVGTAPGLVVPPGERRDRPTVVVLPGPPRELQPLWLAAVASGALADVLAGAPKYLQGTIRLFGLPESELAETLRSAQRDGVDLGRLEITTCLRRGELEVVTRYVSDAREIYDAFASSLRARHGDAVFSDDGRTVDQIVADQLRGAPPGRPTRTIATAESCTGGLLAARLTELPGSSDYVLGGIVAYDNRIKAQQVGVAVELIERYGAVSAEVAEALASGAADRLGADVGVGVTGVAGPGGGTPEKPVGLVWLSVVDSEGRRLTRSVNLPGGRSDVRERSTTVALHLVRRLLLLGDEDGDEDGGVDGGLGEGGGAGGGGGSRIVGAAVPPSS